MRGAVRPALLLAILVAACGDDNEKTGTPPPTATSTAAPTAAATDTPVAAATPTATREPNQFGFSDDLLRVGAATTDISALPAGTAAAMAGVPTFETFTDFDFTLVCENDPSIQLRLAPNAVFDGVLDRPAGAEPFVDCGGEPGHFDPGIDVFADLNGNGSFDGDPSNPMGLEPFDDANGNGYFDALWLGGFDNARAVQAVDEASPVAATAMAISKGHEFAIVVTLDTIGNVSTHLDALRQRIATALDLDGSSAFSPDAERIILTSLHDHQAPDTIGLWGPTALTSDTVRAAISAGILDEDDLGAFGGVPVRNGIDFAYRDWVDDQVVRIVQEAVRNLRPAEIRAASAPAPMQPDSAVLNPNPADQTESFLIEQSRQLLMTDIRWPFIRDPLVLAFQARDAESGETIATLVNWTNHVEAMGSNTNLLSADYSGYLRQRIERALGGVGIFVVGTVGGLQTPLRNSFVPIVDADGRVQTPGGSVPFADLYRPVLDGSVSPGALAEQLLETATRAQNSSPEKAASLGHLIAEVAIASLGEGDFGDPPSFAVHSSQVLVPIENPGFILLAMLGGLEGREVLIRGEPDPGFVTDRPDRCGLSGCIRQTLALVDFGDFLFLTTPGELLPEHVIGRPRPGVPQDEKLRFVRKDGAGNVVVDFGENEFDPIVGLRDVRGGDKLFVFGLAQSELGYFIPQSDFVNVFEGLLPRPEEVSGALGPLADLDLVPLLGLDANPGFAPGEQLSLRQIIETTWSRFPEGRYPESRVGGVSLVDVPGVSLSSHPNTAGNDNSVGPRAAAIVYNAMCDLLDDGAANGSCATRQPVDDDPNE